MCAHAGHADGCPAIGLTSSDSAKADMGSSLWWYVVLQFTLLPLQLTKLQCHTYVPKVL